ncbi:MAG: hypothetical protein ACJASL_004269 [Paraglaciecola sp.]|jgi:hypothetical protein
MEFKLMKILNVKLLVLVFIVQIVFSHNSIAGLIGPSDWNGDDINGFIATSALPGIETSVTTLDFSGEWIYTAIGRESAHTNDIDKTASAGNEALDTLLTFSTSNTSNWGVWDTVNFDTENLFFEDSNGPWNVGLDSFGANNSDGFKLFRLTENTTLNYLAGNASLSLFVGDIIVGFNDNHLKNSDGDYDDIIIAMRATSVPAPGSLALFAVGLFALVFMKRKTAQH